MNTYTAQDLDTWAEVLAKDLAHDGVANAVGWELTVGRTLAFITVSFVNSSGTLQTLNHSLGSSRG